MKGLALVFAEVLVSDVLSSGRMESLFWLVQFCLPASLKKHSSWSRLAFLFESGCFPHYYYGGP